MKFKVVNSRDEIKTQAKAFTAIAAIAIALTQDTKDLQSISYWREVF